MQYAKKFSITFILTLIIRYSRIFPNNDPIFASILPQSRQNLINGIIFACLSMFIFDYLTSGIGIWTCLTAFSYTLIVILFGIISKSIKFMTLKKYISATILGVLIFDIITGPIMSTVLFGIPIAISTVGQIPFTIFHLISAVTYTIILTPFLDPDVAKQRIKVTAYISSSIKKLTNTNNPVYCATTDAPDGVALPCSEKNFIL
jgi:hypothetical protein